MEVSVGKVELLDTEGTVRQCQQVDALVRAGWRIYSGGEKSNAYQVSSSSSMKESSGDMVDMSPLL